MVFGRKLFRGLPLVLGLMLSMIGIGLWLPTHHVQSQAQNAQPKAASGFQAGCAGRQD